MTINDSEKIENSEKRDEKHEKRGGFLNEEKSMKIGSLVIPVNQCVLEYVKSD